MKLLALDVGQARIGVAISDDRQAMAFPYSTIQVYAIRQAVDEVIDILEDEQIGKIYVGLPISDDGSESKAAKFIRRFVEALKKSTSVEVEFVDERYTTKLAHQQLHEQNLKPSENRHIVDQLAAVNILQSVL